MQIQTTQPHINQKTQARTRCTCIYNSHWTFMLPLPPSILLHALCGWSWVSGIVFGLVGAPCHSFFSFSLFLLPASRSFDRSIDRCDQIGMISLNRIRLCCADDMMYCDVFCQLIKFTSLLLPIYRLVRVNQCVLARLIHRFTASNKQSNRPFSSSSSSSCSVHPFVTYPRVCSHWVDSHQQQ